MTVTTGIAAALAAPFLEAVGFLEWETHWSKGGGSAFALNLYKCNLAAFGFLCMTLWFDNYDYLVEFQEKAMGNNEYDVGVDGDMMGGRSRVYMPLPEEQLQAMVGSSGGKYQPQQLEGFELDLNFGRQQQQDQEVHVGGWNNLGAQQILIQADERLQQRHNQGKHPYRQEQQQQQQQQDNNQQIDRGGRQLQQQQHQPPPVDNYNGQQWQTSPSQFTQHPLKNSPNPPHHHHHHHLSSKFTTKAVAYLILSSLLGIVIGDSAELEALRLIGARRVLVVDTIKPFAAAFLANVILKEPLHKAAFLGMALTAYGIFLVLMVSLEKLEQVSERKKRDVLRRKSTQLDDEDEDDEDDEKEDEEDKLLKGIEENGGEDEEQRIQMLGMKRRPISRHDLTAEYEDAIATAKEEADELFLLMEDGRGFIPHSSQQHGGSGGGAGGGLVKARERSGSFGSRGSFGSFGSFRGGNSSSLFRSGSFRSSGSFNMSDTDTAGSFDEDAFYANFIDSHPEEEEEGEGGGNGGSGGDMDYFFGSSVTSSSNLPTPVSSAATTSASEGSSSAVLVGNNGEDSSSNNRENSHDVSTIDTDNLTVGSLTVTSNPNDTTTANTTTTTTTTTPTLTASAIAAAKLDSTTSSNNNNQITTTTTTNNNQTKTLLRRGPSHKSIQSSSSSLSLTSSIQSECGPPPDWIKWHKRETTKTRYARLQTGYGLALLNVVLDAYGFLLTKKYGVGLSTWEINLVRLGFAAVFMLVVSVCMRLREVFVEHLKRIQKRSRKSVTIVDGRSSSSSGGNGGGANSSYSSRFSLSGAGSTFLSDSIGGGGPWYRMPRMKLQSWFIVSMGVLFVTFLTPALSNYAVIELSLALAVTLISVTPLFTVPLAWLMRGEVPTRRGCLGASLAVMGVIVMCIWGVDSLE